MNNLTLLYAEDDIESRTNYAFVLEEYFSKVYIAENGREALDIFHNKSPDMLLLDINMPYIDGLEVTKIVRKENKNIPIVMLTAHSDKEILLRAVGLKLDGYLLKPINETSLKKVILKLIAEIEDKDTISIRERLLWNKNNSNLLYDKKSIKLSKKEYKLIKLLIHSIGEYFPNDILIMQIWDDEIPDVSHDNKLHQLIHRFNKKINDITGTKAPLIENSYTLGYRIELEQ